MLDNDKISVAQKARQLYLFCECVYNLQKRSASSPTIGEFDRSFLASSCNLDEMQKLPAVTELNLQTDSDHSEPLFSPVTQKRRSIFMPKGIRNNTLTASPVLTGPSPKNSPATTKRPKKSNRVFSFIGTNRDPSLSEVSEDDTAQEKPEPTLDDPVLISKSIELLKRSFNRSSKTYWDSLFISMSLFKMNQIPQAIAVIEDQRAFVEISQLANAFTLQPPKGQTLLVDLLESAVTFFSFIIFASRVCQHIQLYTAEGFVEAATEITKPIFRDNLLSHEQCSINDNLFVLVEKEISSKSATLKFHADNDIPNALSTDLDEDL